ncbi:MAG: hypothetical protein M3285_05155 [Actinomycetota bacterium]|nr:hypothetical protein [Actinomycetota bacterium]
MTGPTRTLVAALALVGMGACTGGINAGEQGGRAFIAFAVTLLITLGILWAVLGRDK